MITLYGLVLHCSSDSRVVSYGCLGTLKPEIFREIYLPQYKSHGAKFHQNPRFCVGNHFHDLENVSVKEKQIAVHALLLDPSVCKPCVNDTGAEVAEQQLLQQLPFCLTTAGHKTNCSWREDNIRTSVRSLSLFIGISEQ